MKNRNHNSDDDHVCFLSPYTHTHTHTHSYLKLTHARISLTLSLAPTHTPPARSNSSSYFFCFIYRMQISRGFSPLEICQWQKVSERLGVKSAFPQGSVLIITAPQSNKHTQLERERERGKRGRHISINYDLYE